MRNKIKYLALLAAAAFVAGAYAQCAQFSNSVVCVADGTQVNSNQTPLDGCSVATNVFASGNWNVTQTTASCGGASGCQTMTDSATIECTGFQKIFCNCHGVWESFRTEGATPAVFKRHDTMDGTPCQ